MGSTVGTSRMMNPVIGKMAKRDVYTSQNTNVATYGGIAVKTIYFLLLTVIGIVAYFILHGQLVLGGATGGAETINFHEEIFQVTTNNQEGLVLIVSGVLVLIMPLFAWLIRPIIPVVGTIFAVAQGIIIGFMVNSLGEDYKWIALLATVLTFALVAMMLFLYATRIVKVNKRFRSVISILFFTMVFGGILIFLLRFIPAFKMLLEPFYALMANPVVGIVSGVIFIIISTLFLLADFDTIERCVENQMAKKYEWMAAWGLAYTVIYLYLKIFNLIVQITSSKKSS